MVKNVFKKYKQHTQEKMFKSQGWDLKDFHPRKKGNSGVIPSLGCCTLSQGCFKGGKIRFSMAVKNEFSDLKKFSPRLEISILTLGNSKSQPWKRVNYQGCIFFH